MDDHVWEWDWTDLKPAWNLKTEWFPNWSNQPVQGNCPPTCPLTPCLLTCPRTCLLDLFLQPWYLFSPDRTNCRFAHFLSIEQVNSGSADAGIGCIHIDRHIAFKHFMYVVWLYVYTLLVTLLSIEQIAPGLRYICSVLVVKSQLHLIHQFVHIVRDVIGMFWLLLLKLLCICTLYRLMFYSNVMGNMFALVSYSCGSANWALCTAKCTCSLQIAMCFVKFVVCIWLQLIAFDCTFWALSACTNICNSAGRCETYLEVPIWRPPFWLHCIGFQI